MLQLADAAPAVPSYSQGHEPDGRVATPTGIRLAAAAHVAADRLDEADALTADAMRRFPDSEEVLVIRALVCEVRQDWTAAGAALEALVAVQGSRAPAETWCHWVRVLRCQGRVEQAIEAVRQGLALHPQHATLAQESRSLQALAS